MSTSAPSVTREDLDKAIVSSTYTVLPDGRTTICQITLYNGFSVIGKSACVCKENFDAEMGAQIAFNNAREQLWQLLGFRLAEELWQASQKEPSSLADYPDTDVEERIPYIGCCVAYVEVLGDLSSPPMAAFVAGHNEDGTVNLSVLAPNGTAHSRHSVPFYTTGPKPRESFAKYL